MMTCRLLRGTARKTHISGVRPQWRRTSRWTYAVGTPGAGSEQPFAVRASDERTVFWRRSARWPGPVRPAGDFPIPRTQPGIGFGHHVTSAQYQFAGNRINHRPFCHPAAARLASLVIFVLGPLRPPPPPALSRRRTQANRSSRCDGGTDHAGPCEPASYLFRRFDG